MKEKSLTGGFANLPGQRSKFRLIPHGGRCVEAGRTYVIAVQSKRFQFVPQIVSVSENIEELNFIAQ